MQHEMYGRAIAVSFGPNASDQGRRYSEMRVKFDVTRDSNPEPNKGKVSIYNLSPDTRAAAEKPGQILILAAGYGDTLEDIITGDIMKASSEQSGADIITTFDVREAGVAYGRAHIDMTFEEGAKLKDVFSRVIETFGARPGDLSMLGEKTLLAAYPASGLSRTVLSSLAKREGLEWSLVRGQVQLLKIGGSTTQEAVLLTPDTGLVGIPRATATQVGTAAEKPKTNNGIEVVSLLQPRMAPGRRFELKSPSRQGIFRATKVQHAGDTHGTEWYTTAEGIKA